MKFKKSSIAGVYIIEPTVFGDERGFFCETYHTKLFRQHGIKTDFVQDNHSKSSKGILRGVHYQIAPRAQAKLVRVVRGRIFDVAVDLRKGSKTYGKYVSEILSEENKKMMFIPEGFAHGFLSLEEGTEVLYKTSDFYSLKDERGFRWDDPTIGIRWPKLSKPYRVSKKDAELPYLAGRAKKLL